MDLDDLPKVRFTRTRLHNAAPPHRTTTPCDQLPPEPQLARQFGVSRPTLREVLDLAERGLVVRRQGWAPSLLHGCPY